MYPALSPFKINCDVTLCLHSPDFSVFPLIRKCRKQQEMPFPALDKHLCNCSCKAKIPIDLERRVCTQHVGINAASHTGNIFHPWYNGAGFSKAPVHVPHPGVWPSGMLSMPYTIRFLRPRAFPEPPGRLPEAPGFFL